MSPYPPRTNGVLSALIEIVGYPDQGQFALAVAALAAAPAAHIRAVGLVVGRLEQTYLCTPGQAAHHYAQDCGPDPANGLAASGDDRPEPTSAAGRAGGCQTCTVSVPPRRALAGGLGS